MVLAFWLIFVFVTGAAVGSFLNVAIARLPLEKSLLWPNSRCGYCHQAIAWYDNLPILSYLWLRGRCRTCGQGYSVVYMLVELGTALLFVGLFWIEVVANIHGWHDSNDWNARLGWYPWTSWVGFAWHALLMAFLVVATVCDLKSREIPLQLTLTGTLIGLIGGVFLSWPFPHGIPAPSPPPLVEGVFPWPFWFPLPPWAGQGTMLSGLVTGVIGALTGTFLLRAVGFVFSAGLGKDALGLGDADLMMMAGAFLGWQIVVVAFFLSVFPALLFGIIQLAVRRDNSLPFGPSLSLSVMMTCLAWGPIGEYLFGVLFEDFILFWSVVFGGTMMFFMALIVRLIRGREEEPT